MKFKITVFILIFSLLFISCKTTEGKTINGDGTVTVDLTLLFKDYTSADANRVRHLTQNLDLEHYTEIEKYTEQEPDKRYRTIKYFDQPAAAGYREWISTDSYVDYDIPDIPEYAAADFAVKVDGDSMLPDYENGDIVLVHSQNTTLDGDVGIWWVEGEGTLIKELRKGSLYPHNKEYSPISLRGKEHKCYGRVIGILDTDK